MAEWDGVNGGGNDLRAYVGETRARMREAERRLEGHDRVLEDHRGELSTLRERVGQLPELIAGQRALEMRLNEWPFRERDYDQRERGEQGQDRRATWVGILTVFALILSVLGIYATLIVALVHR